MNASDAVLTLILLRLVIPFGSILFLGEWMRRRERALFQR